MRASALSIGMLATLSGVNLETIRYYERIGLVAPPERTAGGHRQYAEPALRRLVFIRRARELGFGIQAIRVLLDLSEPGHRSCGDVRTIAASHLAEVRAKIADLIRLESVLAETVSRCAANDPAPNCPVLEMLEA
jgi:MerR family transcriptional regulator, mercuric resistance operon regulatory protein